MPVVGHGAGATGSRIGLNVPDRTAALFGDQAIRDVFKQALNDAGRLDSQAPDSISVLDVRRGNVDRQEQAEGIGEDERLASFHLPARIETPAGGRHRVGPDLVGVSPTGAAG